MDDLSINPRVIIGDNAPSPFDEVRLELEDLRLEAGNWLDGAEVKSQAEANELGKLLDKVRQAAKKADTYRAAEKKPHDDAAKAVQDKYNTLIGETKTVVGVAVRIEKAVKVAITGWLRKVNEEQERQRREAAERERQAREQAEIAMACTHQATDIEEREAALRDVDVARQAAFDLAAANKAKAQAQSGGRAIGLRTTYRPEIESLNTALKHYWQDRPTAFTELVLQFAREDVKQGKRAIPGIKVIEEKVV
jgi:hypothetical protein